MYVRTGQCNRCGECCGYPRATDQGQNNPWPNDWPEAVASWIIAALEQYLPMFRITGHPRLGGGQSGSVKLGGYTIRWCWVPGHGLCTDTPPYGDPASYDPRCPCLKPKNAQGQADCALIGTNYEGIWQTLCQPVPPVQVANELYPIFIAEWQVNCPSCSYVYVQA